MKKRPLQNIRKIIKNAADSVSANTKDITSTSIDHIKDFLGNVTDVADTVSKKSIEIKNRISDYAIESSIKIEAGYKESKEAIAIYIDKVRQDTSDKSKKTSKKISESYDNTSQYITLTPEEQKQLISNCAKFFPSTRLLCIINAIRNTESCKHDKTLRNYALFASHVYRNNNTRLPNGWKELTILDDSETGLQSTLYKRIDSKDYIYAFAGTQNLKDWQENGKQIVGLSQQYNKALEYATELYNNLDFDNLTFVGHSQGGGEAAFCAYVLGGKAITFNPAGMSIITKLLNRTTLSNKADIDAYCYLTDTLSIVQELTSVIPFLGLKADGRIHLIYDKFPKEMSIGEFHGMKGFLSYFEE